jgi:hypothetical protein
MTPFAELALELERHRLRLLEWDAASDEEPTVGQQEWPLPDYDPGFEREQRRAAEMVEDLDRALRDENWSPPAGGQDMGGARGGYVYGLIPRRAPMREIVRGYLQPVRYLPLVEHVPERVELFLRIMLPDGRDGLEREAHGGVKWHFHYIDAKNRRSDVILSFGTRWAMASGAVGEGTLRPLFVERHAEAKARFTAHPGRWETEKRMSMYEICARDLYKGVEHFRCAKDGSDAVWPRSAMLTPHPSSLVGAGTPAVRAGGKRKGG